MSKMNVKTGDTVIVISGEGRKQKDTPAKKRKVQKDFPETGRIIVEGVNIVNKHQKPRGQGMPAGIVEKEPPFAASNVMSVCPKCGKPPGVGQKFKEGDGKLPRRKVRICTNTVNGVKCGASLDN